MPAPESRVSNWDANLKFPNRTTHYGHTRFEILSESKYHEDLLKMHSISSSKHSFQVIAVFSNRTAYTTHSLKPHIS